MKSLIGPHPRLEAVIANVLWRVNPGVSPEVLFWLSHRVGIGDFRAMGGKPPVLNSFRRIGEAACMEALPSSHALVRFGPFELDQHAGGLRKDGARIRLQEQPLQILRTLLENPGQIITREELRQKIWRSDTFVDFDHGINNAIKRLREALGDTAETPRYIETLPRRGYRFIGNPEVTVPAAVRRIQSLAVLPLENLSRDPEQEYFAEGLTEALITTLAKIGELRVISRTSAMQYKGVHKPLPEIAKELGVDAIVEGTVLRAGGRVRITAQLIDAPRETHLWAESYEQDLRDVLALQREVAQAIAGEIRLKLTPVDQARFAKVQPVDPEAYDAYLKGRYYWNRRPLRFAEAVKCFQQAIAKDPLYAVAYAGLSDCFCSLSVWGLVSANDGCNKAKGLADKALELDHSLAEAHAALAHATMYQYDFLSAEREFERAIELNPRSATAHQLFGWYLCIVDRYEESYTELQRAIRLDPLSVTKGLLGFNYIYSRRYDQAIEQLITTIELDPDSGLAHGGLGFAYRCKSLYDPAIVEFRKGIELWPGSTLVAWLGEAYAAAGARDDARKTLERLFELAKERYVTPYGVARIYNTLGKKEEALHWLETAYQQQAEWMVLLKVDPCFDDLRPDPRFIDLMRRMNFPV
jgi:TolB-like protein/Tfp pilus assembly protein PilF/DNA-binding response OmpR family regulator